MQSQSGRFGVSWTAAIRGMGILLLGATLAQNVNAGCLDYKPLKKTANWQTGSDTFGAMRFVKVSDSQDETESESDAEDWQSDWAHPVHKAPIVGLWAFKYISSGNKDTLGIPDGTILDGGNTLWYADGNENTVSGVRDPATGDVCLGVWKRTGEWTYVLNHIGLSWDPVKHVPGGPAFIKQHVTLARDKKSYSGTFTINQLSADGKTPALPALIKGTVVATRVTINTDTQESLP